MSEQPERRPILDTLDSLPLECDGLSKVASLLLSRENIAHTLNVGKLNVEDIGQIDWHCWITLEDGKILDLRARMWLGDDERVPHGLFYPARNNVYTTEGYLNINSISPILLSILSGMHMSEFPEEFSSLIFPQQRCQAKRQALK